MSALNQKEIERYSRHFPVIGIKGQERLKQSRVLCIGAGGLGCPLLQYLVAAGIGTIGVVDGDTVDLSNLQRQILFREQDVGLNKAEVAVRHLKELNSSIKLVAYNTFLDKDQAISLFKQYDVIVDATDNYKARYLINDSCRALKKPLVSASIYQFDAQISVFNHNDGPCYQCLYPEPPPAELTPNCAIGGVLGVLPGVIGTIQATEVIKVILRKGEVLSGTLLSLDLLSMRFNQFKIQKGDCNQHPIVSFDHKIKKEPSLFKEMSVSSLNELINSKNPFCLIDVREPYERELCNIGGLHIPLSTLPDKLHELNKEDLIVVHCKSGMRSARGCESLTQAGFNNVHNLEGGILAWIAEIDPKLTKY